MGDNMLLTKSINKIFRTTMTLFILLTIFTIINTSSEKSIRTNVEIQQIDVEKQSIYLLSNDNYLVKANIKIEESSIENKVIQIIENLKVSNNNLYGYLPKQVNVNSVLYENNNIKINFSSKFNEIENKDLVITGIVYSLLELPNVDTVEILVDNKYLDGYEKVLDKTIGINKEYLINNRNNINKVVIYYYNEINNNEYLTPVTKYINDNREKVEIIIEELRNNIPNNLISYISDDIKLNSYREENELMVLDIYSNLVNENDNISTKINSLIVESIFENYDVNTILIQKNGEKTDYFKKK